ncbi:hypothetical protein HG263_01920 [Pseudoalteromonas sp. JBTF-M23]|uniref:Uncharacterized protein n=1 Tax=Pseudoalteromonas caenipelagi TaxID=2726988 RepID=A0A849V6Z9_9GAMM|nr:hypothetical protein [Pseudoalteromonas caenipelagi]NOU49309.1 hypothetical protein [Pseudoalteromonas caenipelagi]
MIARTPTEANMKGSSALSTLISNRRVKELAQAIKIKNTVWTITAPEIPTTSLTLKKSNKQRVYENTFSLCSLNAYNAKKSK